MTRNRDLSNISPGVQTSFRNKLINGGFDVWQRATSSTSSGYVTADRWYHYINSGTGTFAQESTTVPIGFRYCSKFTASATAQVTFYQTIETANCISLTGTNATLSAYVSASTSTSISLGVEYSTVVDNSSTGTYTTLSATTGGTGTAVSGSFTRISGVYAIPSTAKTIRVSVFTTSTIASSVIVYVGGVQFEQGSTSTPFEFRGIGTELALCQRYYYSWSGGTHYGYQTNSADGYRSLSVYLPVPMRALTSSMISVSWNAGSGQGFGVGSPSDFRAYTNMGNTTSSAYISSYTVNAEL